MNTLHLINKEDVIAEIRKHYPKGDTEVDDLIGECIAMIETAISEMPDLGLSLHSDACSGCVHRNKPRFSYPCYMCNREAEDKYEYENKKFDNAWEEFMYRLNNGHH